jgi:hypothetical protein
MTTKNKSFLKLKDKYINDILKPINNKEQNLDHFENGNRRNNRIKSLKVKSKIFLQDKINNNIKNEKIINSTRKSINKISKFSNLMKEQKDQMQNSENKIDKRENQGNEIKIPESERNALNRLAELLGVNNQPQFLPPSDDELEENPT